MEALIKAKSDLDKGNKEFNDHIILLAIDRLNSHCLELIEANDVIYEHSGKTQTLSSIEPIKEMYAITRYVVDMWNSHSFEKKLGYAVNTLYGK